MTGLVLGRRNTRRVTEMVRALELVTGDTFGWWQLLYETPRRAVRPLRRSRPPDAIAVVYRRAQWLQSDPLRCGALPLGGRDACRGGRVVHRMPPGRRTACLLPLLMLGTGCGILGPGDCIAIGRFALVVVVQDSATGGAPTSDTRVIARDGEYADTATIGSPNPAGNAFALAPERPGSYFVTVESPGYRLWSRAGVDVTRSSGKCQELRTRTVLARLQR